MNKLPINRHGSTLWFGRWDVERCVGGLESARTVLESLKIWEKTNNGPLLSDRFSLNVSGNFTN
jgi:hypothetical protein